MKSDAFQCDRRLCDHDKTRFHVVILDTILKEIVPGTL